MRPSSSRSPGSARLWALAAILAAAGIAAAFLLRGDAPRGNPSDAGLAEVGPPGFEERALAAGITFQMHYLPAEQGEKFKTNLYDHGSGVAIGDYDGDGRDDIYFVNQLGRNALYRNKGDGTFEDVTDRAGVGLGDRICVMATFGDYDNDGHQDLFITSVRGGNVLFRNQGDGTFKDVTKEAGLTHVGHSYAAVFFDYDNDGYLDLLVTNTAQWTLHFDQASRYYAGKSTLADMAGSPVEYNILYHNNRDGTFTDVTEKAGLKGKGWAADVAVFDYNGDGRLDVVVTNMFGASQLYKNNGDGTFTDVTRQTLGKTSWGGMGAKVFDFNNDGLLDLYIVDMHSDMWPDIDFDLRGVDETRKYAGVAGPQYVYPKNWKNERELADLMGVRYDEVVFGNTFYKALGGGKFEEISERAGLENFWPWGIAAGDFDNDGFEDVFVPAGMGFPYEYWPNYLLMNQGNGRFINRAHALGIEPPTRGKYLDGKMVGRPLPRSSRAAATADFDGDGRLEIVVNNFNDAPYYFQNVFPKKNYVAFRLRGTKSNRDAIGAVVRLHTGQEIMTRQVNPAGGYLAQSSKTVHFGLGDRSRIDRVEIQWPSGVKQTLEGPALNQLHPVVEPEK